MAPAGRGPGGDGAAGPALGAPCEVARMAGQLQAEEAAARDFQTFLDLLPSGPEPAICTTDGRRDLSFAGLRALAMRTDPAAFGIGREDRLCVVLSNGPESAAAFLALSTHCVYAPLNVRLTEPEIAFEFEDLPARAVVVQAFTLEAGAEQLVDSSGVLEVAKRMDIPILLLTPDREECGIFSLAWHGETPRRLDAKPRASARRGDLAVVLHTSGTTKKPKIVPLTHENIAVGSQCIASTLQLKAGSDLGINIMPLFHIHGLSINVLASMLSGVPVLATPGFQVDSFFGWLDERKPTWYSAVPTMHQQILETALDHERAQGRPPEHRLQLIRNCSAALLPHVAEDMERAFRCVVMPTYAMTESMPIASNPRTPDRGPRKLRAEPRGEGGGTVGSVGLSGGPRVRLCTEAGEPVPPYAEGEVCVAGECVTSGYEFRQHMDADPNTEAFHREEGGGRWLRTGDKGWVDADGFLALTGRFKEIINRGGEKVSPLEVEEVLRGHSGVRDMVAFAMPHEELGETVGVAVVAFPGGPFSEDPEAAIAEIRRHGAAAGLNQKWLPDCLVFVEAVPKGPTGKPARINLASRLHLPSLSGADRTVWDVEGPPPTVDKAPFAREVVRRRLPPQPAKPGAAVQGARVLLSFLVWFNHIGFTNHRGVTQMRNNAGFTMSAFMFILGFTITSSVPASGIPLTEVREFWVSRIGPPHAVFALEVLLSGLAWNMRCDPNVKQCRDPFFNVKEIAEAAFTTRGMQHDYYSGYTWFNTRMYWFIVLFPLYDRIVRQWSPARMRAALGVCVCGATVLVPACAFFDQIPEPYTAKVWMPILWSGMFSWHVFRQGGRSRQRRWAWGVVTDLTSLALLGIFVSAYFDRCTATPKRWVNPFSYNCRDSEYLSWKYQYNWLKNRYYWKGLTMAWLSVFRLSSPLLALWVYGLSVGEGYTAWLLSRSLIARFLAPLAYNVFVMQMPMCWFYWYATRGLGRQTLFWTQLPFPVQFPLPMGEATFVLVLAFVFSWAYDRYLSVLLVPLTVRVLNLVTGAAFWPLTKAGLLPRAESAAESTLAEVQRVVRRLTGSAHSPDSRLEDLNLDSFGTMALIGMLKAARPHLSGLRPSSLPKLGTIAGLADFIDGQEPGAALRKKAA